MAKKPWWADSQLNTTRTKKHEERIAERVGGRRVSGSGAGSVSQWNKAFARSTAFGEREAGRTVTRGGDVEDREFLIEHKRTKAQSYGVKKELLRKLERDARRQGKEPVLALTFLVGEAPEGEDWVAIPLRLFNRMRRELDQLE